MKREMKKIVTMVALALVSANALAADYQESRCAELRSRFGEKLVPNYEGQSALNVRKWTARCYPQFTTELVENQRVQYTDPKDGSISYRDVYPVFAQQTMVDDPTNTDTGKKLVTTDPANYSLNVLAATNPAAAPCDLPPGYRIVSWCVASCYTPDQVVLLPDGPRPVRESYETKRQDVVTLEDKATLDRLSFETNPVRGWTISPRDEDHPMVRIETQRGGVLKVTRNHPIVDSKGRVRAAQTFKVGDQLVRMDGSFDPIVSIKTGTYHGKVYNVDVNSANRYRNIVVAQGFLNGAVMYQNEGTKFLNRVLLRKSAAQFAL